MTGVELSSYNNWIDTVADKFKQVKDKIIGAPEPQGNVKYTPDTVSVIKLNGLNSNNEFNKLLFSDVKDLINNVRNSSGIYRHVETQTFQNKVDTMSLSELKDTRDYLGEQMASQTNDDDPLLNSLLKIVNNKIDLKTTELPNNNFILHLNPNEYVDFPRAD